MKLAKQSGDGFQYRLSREEANALRLVVRQFPVTPFLPVAVSKTDPGAVERQKLLNESLAAHRNELKQKAKNLVSEDKFKALGGRELFYVNREERETMLQVLNHIRVESWRILGEPENLDVNLFELPQDKIRHHQFMELAGYFECCFLNLEKVPGK